MIKRLSIALLLVCAAYGQIADSVTTGSTTPGIGIGTITSEQLLVFDTTPGSGVVWRSSGWGTAILSGVPSERRKDDGKGPTLVQVKNSVRRIDSKVIASASYIRLAESIGLSSSLAFEESRVASALESLGAKVYDFSVVDDWLYRQALRMKANTRWVWKPMRPMDFKVVGESAIKFQETESGFLFPKQYSKRIPERVLTRVAALLAVIPDAVLLVSDFEVVNPDPFLAITTKTLLDESRIWIIDQWDEPGFTDSQEIASPVL